MSPRTILLLALTLSLGTSFAWADVHKLPRHHRSKHVVSYPERPTAPVAGDVPTLVLHPASNIACDTPFRSTRALPCDQPVWVYGRPCEIDLGLGRYRSCDLR